MSTLLLDANYLPTASSLQQRGETSRIAFVGEATPEAVGSIVGALLNGDGGTIVVSLPPNSGSVAKGTHKLSKTDAEQVRVRLVQEIGRRLSPSSPLSVTVDTSLSEPSLIVEVPAGSNRPYVYDGAIYLRSGTLLRRATASDITELLAQPKAQSLRWERQSAIGLEPTSLDNDELREVTRNIESGGNMPLGLSPLNDSLTLLEYLNVASDGVPHNAAAVLFAKNPMSMMPQTRVRAAVRYGDAPGDFSDIGIFEGNAFRLFRDMLEFIRRHMPVASTLPADSVVRSDTPVYPLYALREALLNALVHRDYSASDGGISLLIFPDRLELWNSGTLPSGLSVRDLSEGAGVSLPRNPDIANVFFLRGLIERWGLGTQRIVHACREAGLPDPEWSERGGGVRLVLRRMPTNTHPSTASIPARALQFVNSLSPEAYFDASNYKNFLENQAIKVSDRTMRNDLGLMVEARIVRKLGSTSGTQYQKIR